MEQYSNMFIFIEQKVKSAMVKWKMLPNKKKRHYVPNKPSSVCEFLHRQHANAKLAKVLLS